MMMMMMIIIIIIIIIQIETFSPKGVWKKFFLIIIIYSQLQ